MLPVRDHGSVARGAIGLDEHRVQGEHRYERKLMRLFAGSAVAHYALTPQAWDLIASRE